MPAFQAALTGLSNGTVAAEIVATDEATLMPITTKDTKDTKDF
jgi:hypothetical protein